MKVYLIKEITTGGTEYEILVPMAIPVGSRIKKMYGKVDQSGGTCFLELRYETARLTFDALPLFDNTFDGNYTKGLEVDIPVKGGTRLKAKVIVPAGVTFTKLTLVFEIEIPGVVKEVVVKE